MARLYLIIIVVGGIIGAMLPSGHGRPPAADSGRAPEIADYRPRLHVDGSEVLAEAAVSGQGTTLMRESDGHFYADAKVNGTNVRFLVDTGASAVALSAADARRVGLPFFQTEFEAVGTGASGEVRGKMVTLDRVSLGGKSVENVSGAILEGSDMSLLGQNFLSRMGTIEITGDTMVIR